MKKKIIIVSLVVLVAIGITLGQAKKKVVKAKTSPHSNTIVEVEESRSNHSQVDVAKDSSHAPGTASEPVLKSSKGPIKTNENSLLKNQIGNHADLLKKFEDEENRRLEREKAMLVDLSKIEDIPSKPTKASSNHSAPSLENQKRPDGPAKRAQRAKYEAALSNYNKIREQQLKEVGSLGLESSRRIEVKRLTREEILNKVRSNQ